MSGPHADEFAGGPSDDGVGMAAWQMAQRLEGAREEFASTTARKGVSPLLVVLLARLNASAGGEGR